jgi:cytochrome b involved in lipid metabolism
MDYLTEIVALLIGAAGSATVHMVASRRKPEPLNEYAARMIREENDQLKQEINVVNNYNAKHVQNIAKLERTVFELQHKIEIMEFAPFSIPLPMWMKNQFGIVDFLNDEYVDTFLKPFGKAKEDYIGKTDFDVWPKEVAEEYRRHDMQVLNDGLVFNARETVIGPLGEKTKWRIMKFLRKVPRGTVGIAFPDNGYFDVYMNQKK